MVEGDNGEGKGNEGGDDGPVVMVRASVGV